MNCDEITLILSGAYSKYWHLLNILLFMLTTSNTLSFIEACEFAH